MEEEITKEEIIIAAWLHDVGKMLQRADVKELYDKNLEGRYCKTTKDGRYTHQHVVYTEGFIDSFKNCLPDSVNFLHVKNLAAMHHNPSTYYEWIISQADCLSSGSDRCNILGIEKCEDESIFDEEKLKFYEKPMVHILSTLKLEEAAKPVQSFCKMQPLMDDNLLPDSNYRTSKEEYRKLYEQFAKDFKKLEGLKYDSFLLSLDSLLERYWWCIPSATNTDADISLYQHAKTTAAFASALYEWHKQEKSENELALKTDDKKFLFINGDISGIQKYIFDLKTTSDNAKLLRAKSFELWALSEIISQHIVKKFGVTYANIMTSAGGKFIILLPNTAEVKTKLKNFQLEIEEYFLREFAGKLNFIISSGTESSYKDLKKQNVISLINRIGDDADRAKSKKMQKVLFKHGAVLHEFYDDLQKNGECPKCGIFAASSPKTENADEERQCKNCEKLIEIGKRLVKNEKIVLKTDKLDHFGKMVELYPWDKDLQKGSFYYVNDFHAGAPLMNLPYVAPKDNEEENLLTFEEIAQNSNGVKKIAMFKADIDNLGLIFSQSLGERMSFSRYADLSHLLHYFFSSFYAWFVKNHKDQNGDFYKDKIYTVFSGGDDLCVLGSWDSVLQFALDFQKELKKFTNNNPSVTISGGIVLASSNVPVRVIAESAEENLEKSKARSDGKSQKNAISLFDATVTWEEYEKYLEDGKHFAELMKKGELSTGVVYKFIDFANRAEKTLGKKTGQNGIADVSELINPKERIWKSNMVYVLARNVKNEELKKRLASYGESPESMINSRIAVSYALYMNR